MRSCVFSSEVEMCIFNPPSLLNYNIRALYIRGLELQNSMPMTKHTKARMNTR